MIDVRRSTSMVFSALLCAGLLAGSAGESMAQEMTVRGRVTYNPLMNDCLKLFSCASDTLLTRPEDWIPTPAAVNVIVPGTNRVTRTDRQGNYEIVVPSPNATLKFLYIGHERVEIPVNGRSVIDVKLVPNPMLMTERLLSLIMPQIHGGIYPDIDELAAAAGTDRDTARDILWLVLGNRVMAEVYPNEFVPNYRFADAEEGD